jgi:hypothetical protein
MRKSIRFALLALAGSAALAFAGSAFASFTPKLWASSFDPLIGKQTFELALNQSDDATAKAVIYVGPFDFADVPGGTTGTQIGTVDASVVALGLGGAILPLPGKVEVSDSTVYPVDNPCTPGATKHAATWVLVLTAPTGTELRVPMYVDTVSAAQPPNPQLGSYKISVCLPSPYVDPSVGGAQFGAKLTRATVTMTNFISAVDDTWTGIVTPYVVGTATANPLGTVETQSLVTQGYFDSLKAKLVVKKTRTATKYFAKVSGVVGAGGEGAAATVKIFQAKGKKPGKKLKTLKSKSSGAFSALLPLKKTMAFYVEATSPRGEESTPVCDPDLNLGFGPLPCTGVSTSGFDTAGITKKVKRPK